MHLGYFTISFIFIIWTI
jgi:hypothetical protein